METPSSTQPIQPNPNQVILDKIRAVVSEHSDDFLLVVQIKGDIHSFYRSKTSAFGMASMICHDINQDWWINRNTKI